MEFERVSQDLAALVGKQLRSIGGKSDLLLTSIDPAVSCWKLVDARGRERSRPISELEAVWGALKDGAPAHVESVLRGSGSSRNQPETLIANLPYVEWARIGGRKHLVYVRRCTHEPGTLRRMDSMAEAHLHGDSPSTSSPTTAVIVTDETKSVVNALVGQGYSHAGAASPGAYKVSAADSLVLVVDSRLIPSLESGVYPVLRAVAPTLANVELPTLGLSATRYLNSWVFTSADD